MKTPRKLALILLATLALVVVLQNMAQTEISFLLWSTSMPRALVLLVFLGMGTVIGYLLGWKKPPHREPTEPKPEGKYQ